ncbi:MAG TPA: TatD family hydrolase [Gemmatimonadales bacterium]|nr:TatD family hydrolase [Gemmatimonadales bacterium]
MIDCIDTHCHLGDPAFAEDRVDVMARMRTAGVGRALVIESELARLDTTRGWLAHHPELALATGCHPHDATAWDAALRARLQGLWQGGVVGAGEMGLDYHYDHAPRAIQRRVFSEQLALAVEVGLPVIIHAREADADVAAILAEQPAARVVLHSFSSGPGLRDAGLDRGYWFSFSGMLTFKSWPDLDTPRLVRPDRLLAETDAPYLAPVPYRGRRNEPAFVVEVVRRLAELRGIEPAEMARITTGNALKLFWPGHADPEPSPDGGG